MCCGLAREMLSEANGDSIKLLAQGEFEERKSIVGGEGKLPWVSQREGYRYSKYSLILAFWRRLCGFVPVIDNTKATGVKPDNPEEANCGTGT